MSLQACPVELIDAFVEQCSTTGELRDLRHLREVDKTFCALATPRTFRTIHFSSSLTSARGIYQLLAEGRLMQHVETVVFRSSRSHTNGADLRVMDAGETESHAIVGYIFSHLHRFRSLSTLRILFYPEVVSRTEMTITPEGVPEVSQPSRYYMLETLILEMLSTSERPVSLRSLNLSNLSTSIKRVYMKPEFTQFLSSMEELSLSFLGIHVLGNLSDVVYGVFWTALFIPRFLMPGQSQLASLSLTSDMPIGQDPPVQFDTLRFPALRSLSLNGVVFDNEERLDRFVMNHHATLATLELNSCPIYFPDTVTLDVPRRWSNLLQRFEAGLQQLVQFRVLLRSGWGLDNLEVFEPAETRLTYVSSLSGFGYPRGGWGDPADDAVRAEDAASLERLLDVLHRRRLSL